MCRQLRCERWGGCDVFHLCNCGDEQLKMLNNMCFSSCISHKLRIYSCNCHQENMKWKCPSCRKDFSSQNHKQLYVFYDRFIKSMPPPPYSFISYDHALCHCLFVHADPQPHPTLAPHQKVGYYKNWHFLNHLIGEIQSDTAHYPPNLTAAQQKAWCAPESWFHPWGPRSCKRSQQ